MLENHISFSCSSRTYNAYFTPTIKATVAPTRKLANLNQYTPSFLCSVCSPFVLPLAWNECRFLSFPGPPLLLRNSDIVQLKQTLRSVEQHWYTTKNQARTPSMAGDSQIINNLVSACVLSCYNFAPRWRTSNIDCRIFYCVVDRELCTHRLISD